MTDKWHNLYDDSWKDLIVPEAFAHPAKMAYGLTRRIFKHALAEGWIKAGDVVVDFFGGIGSTGIVGSHFGLQVICVELEAKVLMSVSNHITFSAKSPNRSLDSIQENGLLVFGLNFCCAWFLTSV